MAIGTVNVVSAERIMILHAERVEKDECSAQESTSQAILEVRFFFRNLPITYRYFFHSLV